MKNTLNLSNPFITQVFYLPEDGLFENMNVFNDVGEVPWDIFPVGDTEPVQMKCEQKLMNAIYEPILNNLIRTKVILVKDKKTPFW